MFEEIENETFVEREERILRFWKEQRIFERSLEQREGAPVYSFYDGPPFATGLPHYGHLLAGTIKDVVPRYKTMRGFYVPRRFGWDCHGLPIENEVEKSLGLSGNAAILEYGIAAFNEKCREIVLRYTKEWQHTVERMGRWVDFSKTWHTMDLSFMESVFWVFKQLYDKGLIYQGFKVMPYSAKLGTPLSNFEAGENYKEVDDPSATVAFLMEGSEESFFLAWTTTPWTLPSNLALAVGEELSYAEVESGGKRYFCAEAALERLFQSKPYAVRGLHLGRELVGKHYRPLFPYFAAQREKGAFRIIASEAVSVEEGTGIVHMAPAFGEADFFACQRAGIELVMPVDQNGRFTREVPEYEGLFVKEADRPILRRLKEQGNLFAQATIHHRYPFCWRSDTPLIYKAVRSWFVQVERLKERMVAVNREVHWTPSHLREGRFGKWLEGARDWSISRNRYFGTPIPIWESAEGERVVIGSLAELEKWTGKRLGDLHRHFLDDLTFVKEGKEFRRIPEVFDCWFDAGAMPYAQNHYPFEAKEWMEKTFPADFIAEGIDQTRGWFYTLTVLAVALFDQPAFKNVIVNGILLAEDGSKMSKRLKNYPEPQVVIDKFGADAVRLYMLHSPAVRADDLRFSERGVELVLRQILIPLWNAHSFFRTYARIYDFRPSSEHLAHAPEGSLDRWMLSLLHRLIEEVEKGMDGYDLSQAVEPFVTFIDQLTNWYIRRSRRRFWAEEESADRSSAFTTLYVVLLELTKVVAPFIPFLSEALFLHLRSEGMPESVHLCDFPHARADRRDLQLEAEMDALCTIVSLGHALRKEHKIKVRQPLPALHLFLAKAEMRPFLESERLLILEELNVKELLFLKESPSEMTFSVRPNFRSLGKRLGKALPRAQEALAKLSEEEVQRLLRGESIALQLGEERVEILPEEVEVQRSLKEGTIAMQAGDVTLLFDTTMTEALIEEGIARELVNKVNLMRKEAQFSVTDRVKVFLQTTPKVERAVAAFASYISGEILSTEICFEVHAKAISWDLNGESCAIALLRLPK